jgi:hypothetical protein
VVERLVNGGFDSYVGASKIPKGWTAAQFGPGDGKDSTTKEEGPASVRMVGQVGKTKTLAQAVSVHGAAGVPITLSFWVKTTSVPSAGSCMGQVILYNGAIAKKTKTVSCPTGTTSDFVWKTSTFTAPVAFTSIKVIFTYGKASGTVWFDTASLLK